MTIADDELLAVSPEGKAASMLISDFVQEVAPNSIQTLDVVVTDGFKAAMTRNGATIVALEIPPRIHALKWTKATDRSKSGKQKGYKTIEVSLPYIIILGMFFREKYGGQQLNGWAECFIRNEPLRTLSDVLYYPPLLNCSKYHEWGSPGNTRPLSWICTQHLNFGNLSAIQDPCDRFRRSCTDLIGCLLHTGFNRSSEWNEGESWFGEYENRKFDSRITDITQWEKETKKDPTFILDMEWISTGMTIGQVMSRMLDINAVGGSRSMHTVEDVSRIVFAHQRG